MSVLIDSTSDAPVDSTSNKGFDQSDIESSSSSASPDENAPMDYWFGRKYFECIIAQDVLQNSLLHDTVAHVDSRLEEIKQRYPYALSLEELQKSGLGSLLPDIEHVAQHRAYSTMMFCIGAVVRNGGRAQKTALLAALRRYIYSPEGIASVPLHVKGRAKRQSPSARRSSRKTSSAADDGDASSLDLGRYATALQEHGQQVGFQPVYTVAEISNGSPTFRATVLVADSSCEGIARTKKLARHEAAKKACLQLDIEV